MTKSSYYPNDNMNNENNISSNVEEHEKFLMTQEEQSHTDAKLASLEQVSDFSTVSSSDETSSTDMEAGGVEHLMARLVVRLF